MIAAARWLGYIGLFLVIGASSFKVIAGGLPAGPGERVRSLLGRTRRLGLAGAAVIVVAGILRLWLQAEAFMDPGAAVDAATVRLVVGETGWGTGWLWQMGLALAAAAGFLVAGRSAGGWVLALLAGLGSAVAAPLTGHAVEHPWGAGAGVALHAIHLLGGSVWLGTLAVMLLTIFGRRSPIAGPEREAVVSAMVNRYSPVALAAAGTAIAAGLLSGYNYVGTVEAALGTDYGRLLLVKVGLVAGVAAIGAWNWRRVRPALGTTPGAARLRRSATAELLLGTLLLVVTAVLVALPAPAL